MDAAAVVGLVCEIGLDTVVGFRDSGAGGVLRARLSLVLCERNMW